MIVKDPTKRFSASVSFRAKEKEHGYATGETLPS